LKQQRTKSKEDGELIYLVMKLQWLCLITCHITSSCCIFEIKLEAS